MLNHNIKGETSAEIIDDRTAKIDQYLLRRTPSGQKSVNELISKNDLIRTSYGTGGKVVKVCPYKLYDLTVYSVIYVNPDAKSKKDGSYRDSDLLGINELVAQDGRILHLFRGNEDEVFVEAKAFGQQSLLRY